MCCINKPENKCNMYMHFNVYMIHYYVYACLDVLLCNTLRLCFVLEKYEDNYKEKKKKRRKVLEEKKKWKKKN